MSDSTVDISDFRERARKARPEQAASLPCDHPVGLRVVQAAPRKSTRGSDDTRASTDVSEAHDAQHVHSRCYPRLVPIDRRAKVLPFAAGVPELRGFKAEDPQGTQPGNDDFDLPPAV